MNFLRPMSAVAGTPLCIVSILMLGLNLADPSAIRAELAPPDPAPVEADTVHVPAEKNDPAFDISRLPFTATILDLEHATERLRTIADILEETAGVRVHRYGGIGALAGASIRGSSTNQVEIYLDGIPINSAQWGQPDLSEIPVDNLARAEIYRSGAPVEFGTPGIGGTINLVSRPAGPTRTLLSFSGGSYNTWKSAIIHSGTIGDLTHLVSYRQIQSDGDFPFLYDPGTRFLNAGDDTVLSRSNNRFIQHNFLLKLQSPEWAGWRIGLHDDWHVKDSGLPGHGNLLYEAANFDNRRHLASISGKSPGYFDGRLHTVLDWTYLYRRDRYFNPAGESGLNRNDEFHIARTDGGKALVRWFSFPTGQIFDLVAERRVERFTPEESDPRVGVGFVRERRFLSLGIQDRINLAGDKLSALIAYRYQESKDNFFGSRSLFGPPEERSDPHWNSFHGPSFGARYSPRPSVALKASRTSYARFPTLFELFGTSGEVVENPALVPETGTTWDGSLEISGGRKDSPIAWKLEMSGYRSERDSLIYLIQNSQSQFVARNLERAVARGLEISTRIAFPLIEFQGAFTTQEAEHSGDVPQWSGKRLPYISPREYFARTLWRIGPVMARYELYYFDTYYVDRANTEADRAPARTYQNLGAQIQIPAARLTLDMDLQNLANNRSADVYGYPMPGRTFYLTLELDIDHGTSEGLQ